MLTDLQTQLLEVPDLLDCLCRVADKAALNAREGLNTNPPGDVRQSSLTSETTPMDVLSANGICMGSSPASPMHTCPVQRRKGQHKRTYKRQMQALLMAAAQSQSQQQQQPQELATQHAALCTQVATLQWQLAQRDVELQLLRDTLSLMLTKK